MTPKNCTRVLTHLLKLPNISRPHKQHYNKHTDHSFFFICKRCHANISSYCSLKFECTKTGIKYIQWVILFVFFFTKSYICPQQKKRASDQIFKKGIQHWCSHYNHYLISVSVCSDSAAQVLYRQKKKKRHAFVNTPSIMVNSSGCKYNELTTSSSLISQSVATGCLGKSLHF